MIAPRGTPVVISRNAIRAITRFYQNSQFHPEGPHIHSSDARKYRSKVFTYMKRPDLLIPRNSVNDFTLWDDKYKIAYSKETRWYFGYKIENGIVHIYAARHQINISNNAEYQIETFRRRKPMILETKIREIVRSHLLHYFAKNTNVDLKILG